MLVTKSCFSLYDCAYIISIGKAKKHTLIIDFVFVYTIPEGSIWVAKIGALAPIEC